jgi:CHAT domain-containing protein
MTDELITIAMALHQAGFPSIVATGWVIDDEDAREVADLIYGELFALGRPDGDAAARAVHRITMMLRDRYPHRPSMWAGYLHIGR